VGPRVSVFTPGNRTRFMDERFATMLAQTSRTVPPATAGSSRS